MNESTPRPETELPADPDSETTPRPERELGTRRVKSTPIGTPESDTEHPHRSFREFAVETLKIVVLAALIVGPIKFFVFQPFYVKGASMEPTFHDNEYLIIDKISYRFRDPQRGDIIVFKYPNDPSQYFIKRVIGLPGDTVRIGGGQVQITSNGETAILNEAYLPADTVTQGEDEFELASDEFFVLGDNRSSSLDSRRIGPVDETYIIGRTWLRAWPITKAKAFAHPEYNL